MTSRELADVLSEIDDPGVIHKILELTQSNYVSTGSSSPDRSGDTLSVLYERFIARRQNRSPPTLAQYKRTIPTFIDFAEDNDIYSPTEISTELLDSYIDTLQEEYDSDATIITYTKNVRGWLRWLNKRGQCPETVYRILDKDELGLTPKARDETLPGAQASAILQKLNRQRRGSLMHALIALLWNSGLRIGGARSLDLHDFVPQDNELRLRHRPNAGTRLKNGKEGNGTGDGERNIVLSNRVVTALKQYIYHERKDVTDEYGREPLFTTQYGRASRSTLRRKVYQATSCRWVLNSDGCDGDCDPDSNVCPCSYYPHAIRRGAIVHHLSGGLRQDIASERFDVSIPTLRKHYDPRTKRRRKEDRSAAVRNAWSDW